LSPKFFETPGPGAYLNPESTLRISLKKSPNILFDKAKRFNNTSVKGIAGKLGPGPAYFIQKLESIDSTKK
jgi:hypothetical protein